MKLNEKNDLKFDKKTHTYTLSGKKLESVTTFVHSFFKPFDEKAISKYVARARRNKGEKITATQVRKEWRLVRENGTKMHKQLEDFSNGKAPKNLLPETLQGIMYLNDKVHEWKGCYQLQEEKVYSYNLGLAGTIDKLIIHKYDAESQEVSLLDWKQSKEIKQTGTKIKIVDNEVIDCNYTQYALQLSTYAYILETNYKCKIKDLIIVHLTKDGYKEYKMPYMRDVVETMIKYFKVLGIKHV